MTIPRSEGGEIGEMVAKADRAEQEAAELRRQVAAVRADPVLRVAVALHRVLACRWCCVDGGGGGSTHYEPGRVPRTVLDGWEIEARRVNDRYEDAARRMLKLDSEATVVSVLSSLTVVLMERR